MSDDFVSLHTHTHASRFDGFGSEDQFLERLTSLGQSAVAFTEHGTLGNLFVQAESCKKAGIHLIPGLEAYLADDAEVHGVTDEEKRAFRERCRSKDEAKAKIAALTKERRERDHITLWAMNPEGLVNLYRASSWSWNRGYYFKPRLDFKRLREFSAGVAASTGCPGGVVTAPLRRGDLDEAARRLLLLQDIFQDRLVVEVMPHRMPDCPELAAMMVDLAESAGVSLIATQDAHYPMPSDATAQEVRLCIQTRDRMSRLPSEGRFAFDGDDYHLRSRAEMVAAFEATTSLAKRTIDRALDATMTFAERCTAVVAGRPSGTWLAAPPLPEGLDDYDEWLIAEAVAGCPMRLGVSAETLPAVYAERLAMELDRITSLGFSPYFLACSDWIRWARARGITLGPGRGSGAGSLVCWLLGLTGLDPVRWNLSMDRFVHPSRHTFPDLDVDVDPDRTDEIIDYLRSLYGADRVALIGTAPTFGGKQCLIDVARAFEVPRAEVSSVTGLVVREIEEEARDDTSLAEILDDTDAGRHFRERWPDVAEVAEALEGQIRTAGLHPSGVILSTVPLDTVVPLESRRRPGRTDRIAVTAWDMKAVDEAGLVKIDVLKLKALRVLAEGARLAGDLDLEGLPYESEAVLAAFTVGRFTGVFQYDTPGARRLCKGFVFKNFNDVAAMTALNRPGPMKSGLAELYVRRAADPSQVAYDDPRLEPITADTYGCLVYQEQVIAVARELAGYTPERADEFRRRMAKKEGFGVEEEPFLAGAMAGGLDREAADKLFGQVRAYSKYAFNKAHSYSYGRIAWLCQWLKVYHPGAFYTAALAATDDTHRQARFAAEARHVGIRVAPPDVNASGSAFAFHQTADGAAEIVGSLIDVAHVGKAAVEAIVAHRPYASLAEFRAKLKGRRVTRRTFLQLAKCDAFRRLFPQRRFLVENAATIWRRLGRGEDVALDGAVPLPDYDPDEGTTLAAEVYPLYIDERGLGLFDLELRRLRDACARTVWTASDPALDGKGFALLYGRFNAIRIFSSETQGRVARIALLDDVGVEASLRVDGALLQQRSVLFERAAGSLVVLARLSSAFGASAEAVWTVEEFLSGGDPRLPFVRRPDRTRPKNPAGAIAGVRAGARRELEGMVVRLREKPDRKGRLMARMTLLGSEDGIECLCFSSIYERMRRHLPVEGDRVRVRVETLDRGGISVREPPSRL